MERESKRNYDCPSRETRTVVFERFEVERI